jgi:superoxide dismutase, Cu-Zn family
MRLVRNPRHLLLSLALVPAVAVAAVAGYARAGQHQGTVTATLRNAHLQEVGRLTLEPSGNGSRITVNVSGLRPGFHGFHFHAVGKCDPKAVDPKTGRRTPFASAGGHHNPGRTDHGDHDGDLPSLLAGRGGRASAQFVTDRVTAEELLAGDGTAVMVHSDRDNFAHIPPRYTAGGRRGPDAETRRTGDAGGRVACGVLRQR